MDIDEIRPDVSGWKRIHDHYMHHPLEGMPKMSVIIPCYNQSHVLEASIQSVLGQKNVHKELIIVDAGSEDHTLSLLDKYKDEIDRKYYVTRKNLPLMVNKGFYLANGEYVSYLLPGVEFLNQFCLCHMSVIAFENKFPELMFSGSYLTESSYKTISKAFYKNTDEIEAYFNYYPFSKAWLKRGFIPTAPCSIWYKRDYVTKIGGINYKTNSLRKSIFDLLCRIYKDNQVKAVSTFWSTTAYDRRLQKGVLHTQTFFAHFAVIWKYFGFLEAIFFIFRNKPIPILPAIATKLRSLFKES